MRLLILILGGILAGGAPTALAQDRQFGVKLGVNAAATAIDGDATDSDASDGYTERRFGMIGGGFGVFFLQSPLALQVEALYSQKGSKESVGENDAVVLELDYLDIPVLGRVGVGAWGSTRLHLLAGPSLGYRLTANSRLANTSFDFANGYVLNIEEDVARFDLGLVLGAGADIGRRLVVDARYIWGLNNVHKDTSEGLEIKNRVLSIMGGFRF